MNRRVCLAVAVLLLVPSCLQAADWPPPPPPGAKVVLKDSVYGVLRSHRALKAILENRSVLTFERDRARSAFGPRVDVEARSGVEMLSDSTTRRLDQDRRLVEATILSARLVQPIWDGFATRSKVRQAQATLDSVRERVLDTATALCLDGIIAHIDIHRQRRLVRIAQENVQRHEAILVQARDRAAFGADTQADVTQAASRLDRARVYLASAQNNLQRAEITYERLTGMPAVSALEGAPMPKDFPDTPQGLLELAEKHNPKLRAFLYDVRAARAGRELADAAMYPSFQLEAGPDYARYGRNEDRWTYSFDVLASMRWNLYNSGGDRDSQKAHSARIRQARQELYDYLDDLKQDMKATWSDYQAAVKLHELYSHASTLNRQTCLAYRDQFLHGRRSLLDVLDAENEMFNALTQAVTARGNILVGIYRLQALSGCLLANLNLNLAPLDQNPAEAPEVPGEEHDLGWFR